MRSDLDAHVDRLARAQHGVWTWPQLERLGATRSYTSRRVLTGRWQAPYPAVFAHRSWVRTLEGEALAASWSLTGGLAAGETAAQLRRVPGATAGAPLEILVKRTFSRPRPFVVREALWLPDSHVGAVGVVPCLALPRLLVDLGRTWDDDRLGNAWDLSIDKRLTTLDAIECAAVPLLGRGRPESDRIRRLLAARDAGDPPAQSILERLLADVIEAGGYGPSVAQVPLTELCGLPGRVDRFLPHVRLVVEADGRRWHTRVADFERDHERDNWVQARGHHVARFTYRQLVHAPQEVYLLLDAHFEQQGYQRDASGLWAPAAA